jgi:hypothetical protein
MRFEALEETLVALTAKFALEQVPKINLHGLATRSGPSGESVSDLFSNILDLQSNGHPLTVRAMTCARTKDPAGHGHRRPW